MQSLASRTGSSWKTGMGRKFQWGGHIGSCCGGQGSCWWLGPWSQEGVGTYFGGRHNRYTLGTGWVEVAVSERGESVALWIFGLSCWIAPNSSSMTSYTTALVRPLHQKMSSSFLITTSCLPLSLPPVSFICRPSSSLTLIPILRFFSTC